MKWLVTVQTIVDSEAHGYADAEATADDVIRIVNDMILGNEMWPEATLLTEARCAKVRTP